MRTSDLERVERVRALAAKRLMRRPGPPGAAAPSASSAERDVAKSDLSEQFRRAGEALEGVRRDLRRLRGRAG